MICPTCGRPRLTEWPHPHAADEPLRFTDHGELNERPQPPSQPQGWIDPDPLYVGMQDAEPDRPKSLDPRVPWHGWSLELDPKPTPHWFAWFGLGVCVGILVLALVIAASKAVDAAPRSSPEQPIPVRGTPGAPLSHPGSDPTGRRGDGGSIPQAVPSGAPSPIGGIGTALIGGWATYWATCADCAAAGPLVQAALGPHWKGQTITVVSDVGRVDLRLVTSCACRDRRGRPTIIDVSIEAFDELSPSPAGSATDPGYVAVSIEIPAELPRTDADLRMMLEVRDDELYRGQP